MCIRDRLHSALWATSGHTFTHTLVVLDTNSEATFIDEYACLLYTSDAADERSSVDLGGRRIIKKKTI